MRPTHDDMTTPHRSLRATRALAVTAVAAVAVALAGHTALGATPRVAFERVGNQVDLRVAVSPPGGSVRAVVTPWVPAGRGRGGLAVVRGGDTLDSGVALLPMGRLSPGQYSVRLGITDADGAVHTSLRKVRLASCSASKPRTASQLGTCLSTQDNVFASAAVRDQVQTAPDQPYCLEAPRSDEHVCLDFFSMIPAWTPPSGTTPPLLDSGSSPYDSRLWLDNSAIHSTTGAYWWGPTGSDWKKSTGRANGLRLGHHWLIEFTDDGEAENQSDVSLAASAGDVGLGRVKFEVYNDGSLKHWGNCRAEGTWSAWVTCSPDGRGHSPSTRDDDRFRDEVGFGFYPQAFPVRVSIRNTLTNSSFHVTTVNGTSDFRSSPGASTLKAGATAAYDTSGDGTTLWLAGFRKYYANQRLVIQGRLRSTNGVDQPWADQDVTLVVALANSERGDKGSSCTITRKNVSGTSEATCTIGEISPGGPGDLNAVTANITVG